MPNLRRRVRVSGIGSPENTEVVLLTGVQTVGIEHSSKNASGAEMNWQDWWNCRPRPGWHREAACRGMDTDRFFARSTDKVRLVCRTCPVSDDCLVDALRFELGDNRKRAGLYGGMLPWQRQSFWRVLTEAGLDLFQEPVR